MALFASAAIKTESIQVIGSIHTKSPLMNLLAEKLGMRLDGVAFLYGTALECRDDSNSEILYVEIAREGANHQLLSTKLLSF